jgi:hypothetical protein
MPLTSRLWIAAVDRLPIGPVRDVLRGREGKAIPAILGLHLPAEVVGPKSTTWTSSGWTPAAASLSSNRPPLPKTRA